MPSVDVLGTYQSREQHSSQSGWMKEQDPDSVLNRELLREYTNQQFAWAEHAQENFDYANNLQYTEEQIKILGQRGQSAVPINVVTPSIDLLVSILTARYPQWQASGREDSDRKVADVQSDLASYIWQKSSGNEVLKEIVYDTVTKARGIMQVYVDPHSDLGKGDIKVKSIDPLMVFPDPNSKDRYYRDATHLLVYHISTREQIENMWPEAASILAKTTSTSQAQTMNEYRPVTQRSSTSGQFTPGQRTDSYHEHFEIIERYTKIRVPYYRVYEGPTEVEFIFLEQEFQEYLQEPAFVMQMADTTRYILDNEEVEQAFLVFQNGIMIDEKTAYIDKQTQQLPDGQVVEMPPYTLSISNNQEMIAMGVIEMVQTLVPRIKYVVTIGDDPFINTIMPIEDYTIIPFHTRHQRDPYPPSDISFARPMQDMINNLWSKSIANIASSTNVKILTPKGRMKKEEMERNLARSGAAVIEYDHEEGMAPPQIIQPLPLPPTIENKIMELINSIERVLGVYSAMQGDAQRAHPTHKGIMALNELGQQRIAGKQKDLEGFLNQVGKVIIQLIPFVYTERRVIRITQSNNQIKESVINDWMVNEDTQAVEKIYDITTGRYDLVVVSGSMLPTNRMAEAEIYKELYLHAAQAGLPIAEPMLVMMLRKLDVPELEEMLEKAGALTTQQQQMQQMQEEIKRLSGDLQTAEREALHARQRTELEKFKSDLNAESTAMRKTAQLYDSRMSDLLSSQEEKLEMERKLALSNVNQT